MPASFLHGRMKNGEYGEDATGAIYSPNTTAKRPPRRRSKTGAAELTPPRPSSEIKHQGSINDIPLMDRLMSSKLFGHLLERGTPEQIKASRKGSRIGRFLQSNCFRIGISITICLSAVQMGIASDVDIEESQVYWDACEHVFTSIFVIEVILKVFVDGLPFFVDSWNIVDFCIAATSALDAWILPLSGVDANIGFVRTFRLLRLLRIMRMLRIIPEILMVMEGIGASLRSLFWIILLLVAVLYACSIMCVEVIGKNRDDFPAYSNDRDELLVSSKADIFNNYMFFGSVARSMVSLIGIVFLAEWDVIIRPVFEEYPAMVVMFTVIVILMTLGVLNIIVGVIVENTTQAMEKERRVKETEAKRKKMEFIENLSQVFENIDENRDGALSWYECQGAALKGDQQLAQLVRDIDFPPGITFEEIFQILDVDASGFITSDEFVNGMFRIIHCDTFQRDCLHHLAIGRVMSKMNQDKAEILAAIRSEVQRAMQQDVFRNSATSDSPTQSPLHSPASSCRESKIWADHYADYNFADQEQHPTQLFSDLLTMPKVISAKPMDLAYDPELREDFVARLNRTAKEIEKTLGNLFSILHEEPYSGQCFPSSLYKTTSTHRRSSGSNKKAHRPRVNTIPSLLPGSTTKLGSAPGEKKLVNSLQSLASGQKIEDEVTPHVAQPKSVVTPKGIKLTDEHIAELERQPMRQSKPQPRDSSS